MPETTLTADAAALEVIHSLASGHALEPFTGRDPTFDAARAYDTAERVHAARLARGEEAVGRKIGFTNRHIWDEYGVHQPIWGFVYDTTLIEAPDGRAEVDVAGLFEPRIEPEVVLHFGDAPPPQADEADLLASLDWIAHGFEIVQSPFPRWRFQAADTMAVNGLHGRLVVGTPVPVASIRECSRRLREFRIALAQDDRVVAEGVGANALGSPLLAFAHFAVILASLPQFPPITAGEIVTTGTLTAALPISPGQTWSTTFAGIELPGLTVTVK